MSFKKPHARSQRLAISDDEDSKEPDDMNNISKSECESELLFHIVILLVVL